MKLIKLSLECKILSTLSASLFTLSFVSTCMGSDATLSLEKTRPARVEGTLLIVTKADGTEVSGHSLEGAVIAGLGPDGKPEFYKISEIEKDRDDLAKEIWLYTFSVQNPLTKKWENACKPDAKGRTKGFPLAGSWDASGKHLRTQNFSITCTNAVIGKCVLAGYRPWRAPLRGVPMWDYHQACFRMLRADYCGNGRPHTIDGTKIDGFDLVAIQEPEKNSPLAFEAAWGPDGALCLAKTRIPQWTLDQIVKECPEKLKGRTGVEKCTIEELRKNKRALVFNKS